MKYFTWHRRRRNAVRAIVLVLFLNVAISFHIEAPQRTCSRTNTPKTENDLKLSLTRDDDEKHDRDEGLDLEGKINAFLDTPIFDPDEEIRDGGIFSPLKSWFSSLVKNDYAFAESLYVGLIFFVLVVFSQELLRMKIYGENYIPFTRGSTSGGLW
mmetsp:Transcript_8261/g.10625  ORF Transcript_8261/g.10625 Transcript_8261/m.10625 type:complete len:156 (+) Transcript_8261:35-502(+)